MRKVEKKCEGRGKIPVGQHGARRGGLSSCRKGERVRHGLHGRRQKHCACHDVTLRFRLVKEVARGTLCQAWWPCATNGSTLVEQEL